MSELAPVPRLKVCGVRSLADIEGAFEHGLDAIGLVAWTNSPRHIGPAQAAVIVQNLPRGILPVAVFVDVTPAEARAWLAVSGARAVQLCGSQRPSHWTGFGSLVLRRVAVDENAEREMALWNGTAHGFVLDHPSSTGGSGREVDVELAAALARQAPCLLAGGLAAFNVAERVRAVRPHGVDASSRLETKPGMKDQALVLKFVQNAHAALAWKELPR